MPFKDRISTILHIRMASISSHGGFQSQPTVAPASPPPATPASSVTNSAIKTDPTVFSSPKTITAAADPQPSSEFTPTASPTSSTISGALSPRSATSRFVYRLSTLPKRILRNNTNHQSQTYTSPVTPTGTQSPPRGSPQVRSNGLGKGHKCTEPTSTHTDTSMLTQSQKQSTIPKRPLTYHQPTPVMSSPGPDTFQSFLKASPMGPHPGQPYNPYAPRPASPQLKTAADCWDDDPPHVRRRLQVRHWEVLFGDFNWSRSMQSPKRGRGRKKHDSGDVSPRSQSPRSSTTGGERCSFRMHEEGHRGRAKELERDCNHRPGHGLQARNGSSGSFWNQAGSKPEPHPYGSQCLYDPHTPEHANGVGDEGNYSYSSRPNRPSSGILQARELAQKLARIRMKR